MRMRSSIVVPAACICIHFNEHVLFRRGPALGIRSQSGQNRSAGRAGIRSETSDDLVYRQAMENALAYHRGDYDAVNTIRNPQIIQ